MLETDLYLPIKRFLEDQGYEVKSEIKSCDVVAVRNDESPVIVELKKSFTLPLLLQGVDRFAISDQVYLAVAAPSRENPAKFWKKNYRSLIKLCRRLGLGLLTVETTRGAQGFVEVHCDPESYKPRKSVKRSHMLLKEFAHRAGDPNIGGSTRKPIITAYRQDVLRCLAYVAEHQNASLKDIKADTKVDRASGIFQRDVYGWFMRVSRGCYGLSPKGIIALETFSDEIQGLQALQKASED
jgi:hypothetical protein